MAEGTGTASKLRYEALTEQIIGAAIEVHKVLGPGLLESAYEECLCRELTCGDYPSNGKSPSQSRTKE
jgi:GxxExxY protein